MKQVHIKLSESLHKELRVQAAIKEQTLQDYVVEAIEQQIKVDQMANTLVYVTKEPSSNESAG